MTPLCLTTRFTLLPVLLLALFALALQGCGDGVRVLPQSDADPTGYYTNSGYVVVMEANNTTPRSTKADFQGMVYDGQFMMMSDTENLTYVGTFTVSGNDFSGTVTVYEDDVMTQENVPLSGMITEGSKMTGTLGGDGAANGTFRLNYAKGVDNGPVDMDMVVRTLSWEPVTGTPPNIPFLGVGNDSSPVPNFGAATSGSGIFNNCDFNGRIEPIANTHLYTVSVTMSSCVNADILGSEGKYTGLVSVRDTDRLILALTNGAYDFSGEYKECLQIGCR
ncbi:MAG: hypothetical protein L3J88_06605 [Gammaproteobacteria bacterium]|nr:hypothetical protein [Gammaproteobacteria bacterium]MCF6363004.1 hypothetical protein [Gammaproteobacteria bacterium]